MTTRRLASAALLLSVALTVPGCLLGEGSPWFYRHADDQAVDDEDYLEGTPVDEADFDALWERAHQVLSAEGYGVDDSRTRYADRLLVSRWNTFLAPTRYEGFRTRAFIRFRQPTSTQWTVGVVVQRQRNADIDRPSEPSVAKWEAQPKDANRAELLLWKIELGYREPGGEEDGQ